MKTETEDDKNVRIKRGYKDLGMKIKDMKNENDNTNNVKIKNKDAGMKITDKCFSYKIQAI